MSQLKISQTEEKYDPKLPNFIDFKGSPGWNSSLKILRTERAEGVASGGE
jgi:hypothetical protein